MSVAILLRRQKKGAAQAFASLQQGENVAAMR